MTQPQLIHPEEAGASAPPTPPAAPPPAPLRERALAIIQQDARDLAASAIESDRRARETELKELACLLHEILRVNPDYLILEDGHHIAAVDGLRFLVRKREYGNPVMQLHVEVDCDRHCGRPLWVHVASLRSLGYALTTDSYHDWECLQQFDDDGDPITDRQGDPLPPKVERPRTLTPTERAEAAIGAVVAVGERVAQAYAAVEDLAAGRAIEKSFAIRRLMLLVNEETGKAHSASSAEKVVELDQEFLAYRARERDAEVEKHRADAAYAAARLIAKLEVEKCAALEGRPE